jgi:predicted transcriptional regulator
MDNAFHIVFGSLDDLANRAKKAMKAGVKQHAQSAMFGNLNEFMEFMFPTKFHILMIIKVRQPKSIYELAQMIGKSQPGILKECRELELMNFITLEKNGTRNALVPTLRFDYDRLIVHSADGEFSHTLPSAA